MNQEIPDTVLVAWRDALKAAVEEERERCAKIADAWQYCYGIGIAAAIAAQIRERR